VTAFDHDVDGGNDPAVRCSDDRGVVAWSHGHVVGLAQPGNDALYQAELAQRGERLGAGVGNRDDDLPFPSGTVWLVTVQAYILIQTEVGKAAAVAAAIQDIKGVTMAEDVTGPYDVIVRAEAKSVDELGKLVVAKVQGVPGITRTLTCPVVHL
jgi:DNA-binding Lrp family transcriptional regulator